MSNLTEFPTTFFEYARAHLNSMLDYLIICGAIIIIGAVILIELIKTFNPNINTPKEAVEHIITKIDETENTHEPTKLTFSEIFELKNKLDLLLMPLFGAILVLWVSEIFPSYKIRMLEIISTYYISALIYIAVFVSLYTIGTAFVRSILWFVDKAIELFSSIVKIVKEQKKYE